MDRSLDTPHTTNDLDASTPTVAKGSTPSDDQTRNFCTIVLYQVALRIGWIFKTESIIIPAFLDSIGGTAVLRGFLPVLHRFGASIPPVLLARRLKLKERKKWALAACSVGMGVPFLFLAGLWLSGVGHRGTPIAGWWPWLFLVVYAIFFAFVGMSRLAMDTVQGKLIRASLRGRLFAVSTTVGAPLAIAAAWWKLDDLLALESGFGWVFVFCGSLFIIAGGAVIFLREHPDHYSNDGNGLAGHFFSAWLVLRHDRDFRRLAAVAALFGTLLMMMPHYQAFGRERLEIKHPDLMFWAVTQHAGIVLFSLLAGPLADRSGNRAALHFTVLGAATAPLIAVVLMATDPVHGRSLFWLVFLPIGLTPVTFRLMTNYALELAPPAEHPRYVSTLGLCFAVPVMAGALPVGWLIDLVDFEPVFVGGSVVVGFAGLLTFRLAEPRHGKRDYCAPNEPAAVV